MARTPIADAAFADLERKRAMNREGQKRYKERQRALLDAFRDALWKVIEARTVAEARKVARDALDTTAPDLRKTDKDKR